MSASIFGRGVGPWDVAEGKGWGWGGWAVVWTHAWDGASVAVQGSVYNESVSSRLEHIIMMQVW